MKISLQNISKRFNREKIFEKVTLELISGKSYALTGPNGSGKSTLLQLIAGYSLPSSGKIHYKAEADIPVEDIYQYISISTPYMELVEEFTLKEMVDFHFKFKHSQMEPDEIIEKAYLTSARNKYVKNFSSGMKQRLKLALAMFSNADILLLDEPTTNLDVKGTDWYKNTITTLEDKLIVVASNQLFEYDFCSELINLDNYKE